MRLVQLPRLILVALLAAGVLSASLSTQLTMSTHTPAFTARIHLADVNNPNPPAN